MMAHLYRLRTAGFTILQGALSRERTSALADAIDQLAAKDDALWGAATLQAMGQRGALRNLCDEDQVFAELLADSPIYPLIDELMAGSYVLHSYDGLILFPGEARFPWDFHIDLTSLGSVAFPARATPGINCLYYLDDVTAANGATCLVPASHHSLVKNPPFEELGQLAVPLVGSAGDAVLFDARIWHCAGNNSTEKSRRVIKAFFVAPWIRPQMDYSRAVRPEVQSRLDDRTRRLLGVGSTPPTTVRELREGLAPRAQPLASKPLS
ncbi:MAG: phytanoyl-CoA dioxygenase family protein [bacterium]